MFVLLSNLFNLLTADNKLSTFVFFPLGTCCVKSISLVLKNFKRVVNYPSYKGKLERGFGWTHHKKLLLREGFLSRGNRG